jgi:hypothetical protein
MNVMLDEPGILTAVQGTPAVCAEVRWGKRLAAVRVQLDQIDPGKLGEMLADAWEQKAPRSITRHPDRDVSFRSTCRACDNGCGAS